MSKFFSFESVNSHERTQLAQNNIKQEIRFCKNLTKLTGSAVRINSKKPKGKKTMKEKKKLEVATPGFKLAPQLPPAKKVRLVTTGQYEHCFVTF